MQLIEPKPDLPTIEQGFNYIKKGDLGKAITIMDTLIEHDAYFAPAYWGRALCYEYRAINFDDVNHAIKDYSKSIVYSKEPSSLSYGRRGILYFKMGDYDKAISDLDFAVDSDQLWLEARFYRGRTLFALSRNESDLIAAEDDFTKIINQLEFPFAPAYFWRGQVRRSLQKSADAVNDYKSAIVDDPDDVLALNALAYCYEHAIGTEKNLKKAENLYKKAAKTGFIVAQKNLAWFYGGLTDDLEQNAKRSAHYMHEAASSGDAEAQNQYGLRLLHGLGVAQNAKDAAHYFFLATAQKYPAAMVNLAKCYENGNGVEHDTRHAFILFERAANFGFEQAQFHLGRCYYFGLGVIEDNDKAFNLLLPLADKGLPEAQDLVGLCYENGFGVKQNHTKAGKYFTLAHNGGDIYSTIHLAARYQRGRGVKQNLSKAIKLYSLACENASGIAWQALGKLYYFDKCDYEKAADAFKKAIDLGEKNLATWLARSLMHTKNPAKHAHEAYTLLTQALATDADPLVTALLLADFDFLGVCGFKPNQALAIERIKRHLPTNDVKILALSCAFDFLAQAHELGIGVEQDIDKAIDYYIKAGESNQLSACRCFVSSYAHLLYEGIGCPKNRAAADAIISNDMASFKASPDHAVLLMYIWSQLTSDAPADGDELLRIAQSIQHEEPYDAFAAYYSYYLSRGSADEDKCLKKLKHVLKFASPYYARLIEWQLTNAPDEPLYPRLTARALAVVGDCL